MRRRDLFALTGVLSIVGLGSAIAQPVQKPARIGILRGSPTNNQIDRFKARLSELGHIEERDFVIEISAHGGQIDRLPQLAAALVEHGSDVIVASGAEAVLKALFRATSSAPIVFLAVDFDPVALGYVAGLPRPGGNLTGIFARQVELTVKRMELLKEALPKLSDLGVFADAFTTDSSEQMNAAEGQAERLRLRLLPVVLPNAPRYDFNAAVEAVQARGAQGVLALMSPGFFLAREGLVQSLLKHRVPASFGLREFADAGGLMSYGANIVEMYGRAADYVHKILTGAKPADLPVEQPSKFELVINLKTAKTLGLTMPQSILARADEVIE